MGIALGRLAAEDPSFRLRTDEESGQTIISGMGELHLEIIVDRMKREFGVEANVGKPQVAYRETIRKTATDVEGKFVRQSGQGPVRSRRADARAAGAGQGLRVRRRHQGRVVPREYIPAVEKGIIDTLPNGVLAGFPVVDVKATLTFGSYHDVDSNENAFKMAASMGFKEAMPPRQPRHPLEPMMAVEVETPEDYAGSVMGDLSSRRGMVQGMDDMPGGGKVIKAEVPLSEMFGYSTSLRSDVARPCDVHHGVQALQRSSEERRRRDHHRARQGELRRLESRLPASCSGCQSPGSPDDLKPTDGQCSFWRNRNGKRQV